MAITAFTGGILLPGLTSPVSRVSEHESESGQLAPQDNSHLLGAIRPNTLTTFPRGVGVGG